jgi:hypothetical protein
VNSLKKFLPMFLIAVSFCLISCGNKTVNDPDLSNAPEVSIEATDNQNLDEDTNLNEENNLDENDDVSVTDDASSAPQVTVTQAEAE